MPLTLRARDGIPAGEAHLHVGAEQLKAPYETETRSAGAKPLRLNALVRKDGGTLKYIDTGEPVGLPGTSPYTCTARRSRKVVRSDHTKNNYGNHTRIIGAAAARPPPNTA